MKLAEALILRKDLKNRLEQLRSRLVLNAKVQDGEKPAEEPSVLLAELTHAADELEGLIASINLTNAAATCNGKTLTELLAERECLSLRVSMMHSLLDSASDTVMRGSRTEVKVLSTVPVKELRKETDELAAQLRKLELTIQAANWSTDLK